MDSRKAEGMRFAINLITPDNGEKFLIELENAITADPSSIVCQTAAGWDQS